MDELILGFDLCNDYSQVSVYNPGEKDPVPIVFGEGAFASQVSTTVCKKKGLDEWLIGEEAFRSALFGHGTTINQLVRLVMKDGTATVENVRYTAEDLLCLFIRTTLEHVKEVTGRQEIAKLVFTLQTMELKFMDVLMNCMDRLGIDREKVHIISHSESFLYATLSQSRDLWANTVGLFDLTEGGLQYYEMSLARGAATRMITARHEALEEGFSMDLLDTTAGCRLADSILTPCAERLMQKKVFSAVFLTGKGFVNCQEWATSFLRYVCNKRRVFIGDSMFARGACVRAADLLREKSEFNFAFSCEGCISSSVAMNVIDHGTEKKMFLAEAGRNWYESRITTELIVDGAEPIVLEITNPATRDTRRVDITLDEFPVRDRMTTRIRLSAAFVAENMMSVWVKDLGFGDLYPASGRTVKQDIRI